MSGKMLTAPVKGAFCMRPRALRKAGRALTENRQHAAPLLRKGMVRIMRWPGHPRSLWQCSPTVWRSVTCLTTA